MLRTFAELSCSKVRRGGPCFWLAGVRLSFALVCGACGDDGWDWDHDAANGGASARSGAGGTHAAGSGAGARDASGANGSSGGGANPPAGADGAAAAGGAGNSNGGGSSGSGPIPTGVYAFKRLDNPGGGIAHVSLTRSLDVPITSISADYQRDITGDVRMFGGSLFVSGGDELTKYEIDDALTWQEKGMLDFTKYQLPRGVAFGDMTQVAPNTVLVQLHTDQRLAWDPVAAKLGALSDTDSSKLPKTFEELPLHAAGNGNHVAFKNQGWLLYNFADSDQFKFGSKSYAATYDLKSGAETLTELPCPGIDTASQDEDGRTYFSSASYAGLLALYELGPKSCVARITADGTLDQAWTTDLLDVTKGHYPTMLQYGRDGWAVMNVLYHEDLGANFSDTSIPPAVLEELWRRVHWKVWLVNLRTKTGHPVREFTGRLDPGDVQWVGGRVLINGPMDEFLGTSKIYELLANGNLEVVDEVMGVGTWFQLR